MSKRLSKQEIIGVVDNLLNPKGRGFSPEEMDEQLLLFCINCPDPSAAMDIILNARKPVTAEEIVSRAFLCTPRIIADVPFSKLSANHPLRKMSLDPEP